MGLGTLVLPFAALLAWGAALYVVFALLDAAWQGCYAVYRLVRSWRSGADAR